MVRAGIVPQLRKDIHHPWEIVTIVPNDRPLYNLAAALLPLLEPELDETDRLIQINKQADAFISGDLHVRDVIQRVLEKQQGTARVMLIVDQWEELYTLTNNDDERRRFIDELLAASTAKSLSVVLTLRGDFVGHALAYRPLSDCMQDAQVNLGPMQRDELQAAIEQPAQAVQAAFESGLVNRILDDVGEEPGNLPLLAFVLQKLWEDASNDSGRLRHHAYEQMGGVQGALANAAEAAYGRLSEVEKQAVQRVFLQLVRPSPTGEDTRRRATFVELKETTRLLVTSLRPLVTSLATQRLLVTNTIAGSQTETVEVAHEALIRHWQRLKEWLNQDREFLLWRERLRTAREEWLRTNQDKDDVLRGAILSEAERWLGQRSELTDDERAYITQSVSARTKQERRRRRVLVGSNIQKARLLARTSLRT